MCVMSMVLKVGREYPREKWTKPSFDEYKDLLDKIKRIDEILEQPDCHDPNKENG